MKQPGCELERLWTVLYPDVPTALALDNAKHSAELSKSVQVME